MPDLAASLEEHIGHIVEARGVAGLLRRLEDGVSRGRLCGALQVVSDVYALGVGDYVELMTGSEATSALSVDAVFGMARVG